MDSVGQKIFFDLKYDIGVIGYADSENRGQIFFWLLDSSILTLSNCTKCICCKCHLRKIQKMSFCLVISKMKQTEHKFHKKPDNKRKVLLLLIKRWCLFFFYFNSVLLNINIIATFYFYLFWQYLKIWKLNCPCFFGLWFP